MRIDWELAQIRPNKKQKIEGKFLIDLRTKIYELEHNLALKNKEIDQSKEKLSITEQSFNQLTQKFITTEKNLNNVISDLKKKLMMSETKVIEKVDKVDGSMERIKELEQKISNKDNELMRVKLNLEKANKEIESIKIYLNQNSTGKEIQIGDLKNALEKTNREVQILKHELEQAISTKSFDINRFKTELEQKSKQIEINKKDLDHTILTKDSIIAKLEKDLEKKINQIEELNNTINDLYDQMSNNKDHRAVISNESDVMRRIKELLDLKGFITDKELEQIL
jgi:chromosome segregation ATPase